MNKLVIAETKHSPYVALNPSGEIDIHGRCIIEDTVEFFKPILAWIDNIAVKTLKVDLNFEYVNTSSVKQIYSMLLLIKSNPRISEVYINWYYEEGDEDTLELGKDIESQVNLPFDFYEYEEKVA